MSDIGRAREALEDAVLHALETGMTAEDITSEVKYAIETAEENA